MVVIALAGATPALAGQALQPDPAPSSARPSLQPDPAPSAAAESAPPSPASTPTPVASQPAAQPAARPAATAPRPSHHARRHANVRRHPTPVHRAVKATKPVPSPFISSSPLSALPPPAEPGTGHELDRHLLVLAAAMLLLVVLLGGSLLALALGQERSARA
jgi:hypothetical protein